MMCYRRSSPHVPSKPVARAKTVVSQKNIQSAARIRQCGAAPNLLSVAQPRSAITSFQNFSFLQRRFSSPASSSQKVSQVNEPTVTKEDLAKIGLSSFQDKLEFLAAVDDGEFNDQEVEELYPYIDKVADEVEPIVDSYVENSPFEFKEKNFSDFLFKIGLYRHIFPDCELEWDIRKDVRSLLNVLKKQITNESIAETQKVFESISPATRLVLAQMQKHGKEHVWEKVLTHTERMFAAAFKEKEVTITSAQPLTKVDLDKLMADLQQHYFASGSKLLVTTKVDPNVLAGVLIDSDGERLDFTLKTELEKVESDIKAKQKTFTETLKDLKQQAGLHGNLYHLMAV